MRVAVVVCSLLVVSPIASQELPVFELATIRPSAPGTPTSIQVLPGGRLVTSNTPLSMLVPWAFQVDDSRVIGIPRGAASARFDIVAQAPAGQLARGQVYLMVQRLLAGRFGLTVHRETRTLTSYVLVTDDAGLKLKLLPSEPAGASPFQMNATGVLTGTRVTADMLATVLASQLRRPVANKTGLTGVFDFTLQWQPEGQSADSTRPSLTTALREQLGLRLVSQSAPVEVIVVDRIEMMPTGN